MFLRFPWVGAVTVTLFPPNFPIHRRPVVERYPGELSLDWGRFEVIFTSAKRLDEERRAINSGSVLCGWQQ